MLFISVYTYQPQHRDEILKRRAEGLFVPEDAKCLGQWSVASGGRTFTLFELNNASTMYQWCHAWTDLGSIDVYPVVDTEELIKAMTNEQ